jgi:hypothetical protein
MEKLKAQTCKFLGCCTPSVTNKIHVKFWNRIKKKVIDTLWV